MKTSLHTSLIIILSLCFHAAACAQEYYNTNHPVELLLKEKKFEDALAKANLMLDEKAFLNADEENYLNFIKNLSNAQINIWRKNDVVAALESCKSAEIFIKKTKKVSPVRRSDFYQYYSTLLGSTGNSEMSTSYILDNIQMLSNEPKSEENQIELADNYNRYATKLYNLNKFDESLEYMIKALAIYNKHNFKDGVKVGEVHHGMGIIYTKKGYNDKADYHFQNALVFLESKESVENWFKLVRVYELLINSKVDYGKIDEANLYVNKFTIIYDKIVAKNDPTYFNYKEIGVRYYTTLVNFYASTGNKREALSNLEKIKKLVEINDLQNTSNEIVYTLTSAFSYVAILHRNLKEYHNATELNKWLLKKLEKTKYENCRLLLNANLAYVYSDLQKNDEALYFIDKAISEAEKINFQQLNAYQTLKNELLLKLKKEINPAENTIKILSSLTGKTFTKGTLKLISYQDFKGLNSERDILILLSLAQSFKEQYLKDNLIEDLEISYKLLEISSSMFSKYYQNGVFNPKLSELIQKINDELLMTAFKLKTKNSEALLTKIENNTSRYLWNEFILKNKDIDFGKANQSIRELQKLNNNKNKLIVERELVVENDSDRFNHLTNEIVKLERQIKKLEIEIKKGSKQYELFSNPTVNIRQLQENLKNNQTILRYFITTNNVFLFKIKSKKVDLFSLGNKSEIENKVKLFSKKLSGNDGDFDLLSRELYTILVPFSLDEKENLLIVNDDFLNYIPFESLKKSKSKFLVQLHAISYENSLLFFQHHITNKKTVINKLIAFAPLYNQKSNQSDISYLQRTGLYELKGAQEEARRITDRFSGTLYSGEKATKTHFLNEAGKYQIIHLSMHSIFDEKVPENSNLVFNNNEKLYFSELYGTNIPAEMAVLSACNTGSGFLKNGEGIMSMSRAFTFAGLKSCVYSLWQVPDKETSEIMISFYENLKNGQAKDEALTSAKTTFIANNPMKNHPFYWAGFVVNGDVSPIYFASHWMLYLGIVLIVGVLVLLFRKKLFKIRQ